MAAIARQKFDFPRRIIYRSTLNRLEAGSCFSFSFSLTIFVAFRLSASASYFPADDDLGVILPLNHLAYVGNPKRNRRNSDMKRIPRYVATILILALLNISYINLALASSVRSPEVPAASPVSTPAPVPN